MTNILNRASAQVGKVAMTSVDHVVATRLGQAEALVRKIRAERPTATHAQVADAVIKKFSRELAGAGALSGAIAAAPAVGTTASLATAVADIGLAFARITEMVMAVGVAYGHDLSNDAQRKASVYHVLSGATGELTTVEKSAADMKKHIGKTAVGAKTPAATTTRIVTKVGTRMVAKLATKEAMVKVASLIPLGIGAGVGAAGNKALASSVGRTAKKFFDTWPKADNKPQLPTV